MRLILMSSILCAMSSPALAKLTPAEFNTAQTVRERVLAAGVPADAYDRLVAFRNANLGRAFPQSTYTCKGREAADVRTCDDKLRTPALKLVTVKRHRYAAIVDFSIPSVENRFFLIDLDNGAVKKYRATHGKGSGADLSVPDKFGNVKDSKMTSLGIYVAGEVYKGSYGGTLRLYGLEKTNDQAYNRDIVMHPAWYASEKFITSTNPKTKQPFGRLGVSWGCPALDPRVAPLVIPLLKEGGLVLHVTR